MRKHTTTILDSRQHGNEDLSRLLKVGSRGTRFDKNYDVTHPINENNCNLQLYFADILKNIAFSLQKTVMESQRVSHIQQCTVGAKTESNNNGISTYLVYIQITV